MAPLRAKTKEIEVLVESFYQLHLSVASKETHVFAYRIEIHNHGEETVQLRRRTWFVLEGDGQEEIVKGEGVVGKQPYIKPGSFHEYVSGCDFKTGIGRMHGYYTLERVRDGYQFDVLIPEFVLTAPHLLN